MPCDFQDQIIHSHATSIWQLLLAPGAMSQCERSQATLRPACWKETQATGRDHIQAPQGQFQPCPSGRPVSEGALHTFPADGSGKVAPIFPAQSPDPQTLRMS